MAKAGKNASRRESIAAAKSAGVDAPADDDDVEEESWTFVGGGETDVSDDFDPEAVARRTLADLHHPSRRHSPGAVRDRRPPQPVVGARALGGLGSGAVGAVGAKAAGVS